MKRIRFLVPVLLVAACAGGPQEPALPPPEALPVTDDLPLFSGQDQQEAYSGCTPAEGWQAIALPYPGGLIPPGVTPSGAFSADGKAILIHGVDGRIWRYPTDADGTPEVVSTGSYGPFRPSPDGRWIAAIRHTQEHNRSEVWLIDLQSGEEQQLVLTAASVGDWRPSSDSFFFTSWRERVPFDRRRSAVVGSGTGCSVGLSALSDGR